MAQIAEADGAGTATIISMFARSLIARRLTAFVAIVAVAFAALGPALSQAMNLPGSAASDLMPVCTHAGLKWVDVATGELRDAPPGTGMSSHLERCPFCLSHGPALLPASRFAVLAVRPLDHERPFLFDHAPRPLFVWSSAQSRAPPARA
jgi:hypothetical protein